MPDASGPRQHGITTPGDHGGIRFAIAGQPFDAFTEDLYDTAAGMWSNRHRQRAVADVNQFAGWQWQLCGIKYYVTRHKGAQ